MEKTSVQFKADVLALNRLVKLTNLLLRGAQSKHHTWVTDLNDALKGAVTTPANLTFSYKQGGRGRHSVQSNSLHQLLTLLRDSLLHVR